jgi:hypothetical protein
VRKMARGTAVLPQVEVEKVVERLVWTMWGVKWCVHAQVVTRWSWRLGRRA